MEIGQRKRSPTLELQEPPAKLPCSESEMIIKRLLKWHQRLPNNPTFDSSIEVFQSHCGYGIRATRDLSKSQCIIRIPPSGWREFSADVAVNEAKRSNPQFYENLIKFANLVLPNSADQADTLVKSSCLATKLIIDKEESFRHPYVEFLHQSTFPGNALLLPHPLLMGTQELGENCLLTGSSAYRAIAMRRKMYDYIGGSLFGNGNPMREEYKWAIGVVLSRALSSAPLGMPLTLVPVLDLVNHSYSKQNADHQYNKGTGEFSLITTKEILAGEEVYINYGEERETSSFMSLYGFYDADNKNDRVDFTIDTFVNSQKDVESVEHQQQVKAVFQKHIDGIVYRSDHNKVNMTSVKLQDKMKNDIAAFRISKTIRPKFDHLLTLEKKEIYDEMSTKLIELSATLDYSKGSEANRESKRIIFEVMLAAHQFLEATFNVYGRVVIGTADSLGGDIDRISKEPEVLKMDHNSQLWRLNEAAWREDVDDIRIVQLIIRSTDKLIEQFTPDHIRIESPGHIRINSSDPPEVSKLTLIEALKIKSPLEIAGEGRLRYLLAESEITPSPLNADADGDGDDVTLGDSPPAPPSPSAARLQWRATSAAVSAKELDGLLRLRSFCTAYLLANLVNIPYDGSNRDFKRPRILQE